MALKFKCPDCSEEIISKFCKVGELVKCTKCGAEFRIPVNAQQTDGKSTLIDKATVITQKKIAQTNDEETQIARGKPYPGISQAIWLVILTVLLTILLIIPIGIIGKIIDYPLHKDPAGMAIVNLVAIGLVLKLGFDKSKASFKEVFSFTPIQTTLLIPMSITLIGFIILQSEMNTLISIIIPGSEDFAKYFVGLVNKSFWGAVVLLVIVAPFAEEMLFRGLILRGFFNRYKIREAVMVSALLFGLFHLNIFQFLSAFFVGILFAWWFLKTRSLLPCIFGHVLNNSLILIFIIIVRPTVSDYTRHPRLGPLWIDILGLVLLVLGIWLSTRMFKKVDNISVDNI